MEKEKINVKRLAITIGLVLLTAGLTGGITWYFMDQADQTQKSTINSQNDQIKKLSLEVRDFESKEASKPSNVANNIVTTSEKEQIEAFCKSGGSNLKVVSYQQVVNENGNFVLCSMGYIDGPTGFVIYGKKVNDSWKNIFQGQENPSVNIANQNKIPHDLYMSVPDPSVDSEFHQWKY